jgi:hypothetical protein
MKDAFNIYEGKLINVEHEDEPNRYDDDNEEFVEIFSGDEIHIIFIKKYTFDVDEGDSDELYSDYSSYEEEDLDLADDEVNECTKGPLEDNVIALKNIAMLQGYSEEESLVLVSQYGDWLLKDPRLILIHEEYLNKWHKCW